MQQTITINRGFLSPYFSTDEAQQICELDRPYILVTLAKLSSFDSILSILERTAKAGRPLLIIAGDVGGDLFNTLIINKMRGSLNVCAIKRPGFGPQLDELEKIVQLIGATLIDDETFWVEGIAFESLGQADRIIVTKDSTLIIIEDEEERARRAQQTVTVPAFRPKTGMDNMNY